MQQEGIGMSFCVTSNIIELIPMLETTQRLNAAAADVWLQQELRTCTPMLGVCLICMYVCILVCELHAHG